MKSPSDQVLEKLSLAVVGEDPMTVLIVLAAFSRECCEKYGMPVEQFIKALKGGQPS